MPTTGEYSEVAICNLALAGIGRGAQITAMDEASTAARLCKARFPYARDAVLRAHDWNFAARRAELPANATAPSFEYARAFDLPGDCLLVREVYEGNAEKWVVEGRQILTDMGAPIYIRYTTNAAVTAHFDPLFFEALAARIAADVAMPLSESAARADGLYRVYLAKLQEAKKRDSQEGQADSLPQGSWLDARHGGGTAPYRDWRD